MEPGEPGRVKRRLAAILAADVAGYSRLIGADEEGALERLKAVRRDLIDPKIAEHRGRIGQDHRRRPGGGICERRQCRPLRGPGAAGDARALRARKLAWAAFCYLRACQNGRSEDPVADSRNKTSQKYLKFSDQPIWLSLSVG
jgi:class 3 adenylate cyclase